MMNGTWTVFSSGLVPLLVHAGVGLTREGDGATFRFTHTHHLSLAKYP